MLHRHKPYFVFLPRTTLIALLSLALVACGGGGGGTPGTPSPPSTLSPVVSAPNLQNASAQTYTINVAITPLSFTNSGGAITSCTVSPALPTGLAVTASGDTCVISGTPRAVKARGAYRITGSNTAGRNIATVSIATGLAVFGQITFDRVPAVPANTPGCASVRTSLCHAKTMQLVVKGASVELLDGSDVVLTRTQTDDSGNYRFNAAPDELVRVRVRAELLQTAGTGRPGWHVIVQDNTSEDALYTLAETSGALPSARAERDLRATSGWNESASSYNAATRVSGPFAILDTIYKAITDIVAVDPDVDFSNLVVNWSVDNRPTKGDLTLGEIRSAHYSNRNIYLNGAETVNTDEFDQFVIVHEWGHFFEDTLSRSDSDGGPHRIGDSLDMTLAFGEGFASALVGMVLDDPLIIDTLGQTTGGGFNAETSGYRTPGWYNEGSVLSILYDLYDAADDGNDQITLGLAPLYDILIDEQKNTPFATSIFTFITALKENLPAQADDINLLVNGQSINGADIDPTGSRETNNGPPVRRRVVPQPADLNRNDHVLPIYTRITVDAPAKALCTTTGFDPDSDNNKLSSGRYMLFTTNAATLYTINAPRSSTTYVGAPASDLLFVIGLPEQGVFFLLNPPESQALLPNQQYIMFLTDEAVSAEDLQGRACFDVSITSN